MSQQLEVVLKLREQELEKLEQQLGVAQQQLSLLTRQRGALEDYAMTYQQQLSAQGSMPMQQRQIIAAYLLQVQSAIVGQGEKITQAAEQVEQVKQKWLQARLNKDAIAKLVEKRQQDEVSRAEKQAQKTQDDLNQSAFFRKNNY